MTPRAPEASLALGARRSQEEPGEVAAPSSPWLLVAPSVFDFKRPHPGMSAWVYFSASLLWSCAMGRLVFHCLSFVGIDAGTCLDWHSSCMFAPCAFGITSDLTDDML